MPELRQNRFTKEWVIVATERAKRPEELRVQRDSRPPLPHYSETCPFCPGNENSTPPESWADRPGDSRPDQPGWSVRVVPNKYPAVRADAAEPTGQDTNRSSTTGIHEVII